MARKLEGLEAERQDTKEGFDDANDTGREIAEIKKRQSALIEGLTPPEDSDREAILAAKEAVREDARADYHHRTTDIVDDLTQRSEGLRQEGSESEEETRDSARHMEQASGVSEYGRDTVDHASEQLNATGDEFRSIIERLRAEAEEAKRRADDVESDI